MGSEMCIRDRPLPVYVSEVGIPYNITKLVVLPGGGILILNWTWELDLMKGVVSGVDELGEDCRWVPSKRVGLSGDPMH